MDGRAATALPSMRLDRLQALKNVRMRTDVTFFARKRESEKKSRNLFLHSTDSKQQRVPSFSFGSRPASTIGCSRNSNDEPPPNFSWIDPGWLAACAMPTTAEHYRYLNAQSIRHVISLMKHKPEGAVDSIQLPKLNRIKIRIEDFCAPTLQQVKHFVKLVEDANDRNEAVVVHCAQGKGRTGTMCACYLVKQKRMKGKEALNEIRRMRPGSVETPEQEKIIEQYYQHITSKL